MAAHVLHRADELSDKVALAVLSLGKAERWSFSRLKSAVQATGTGFLEAGLSPGDRVLIRLGNTVDYPIAYLGATPVPASALALVIAVLLAIGLGVRRWQVWRRRKVANG